MAFGKGASEFFSSVAGGSKAFASNDEKIILQLYLKGVMKTYYASFLYYMNLYSISKYILKHNSTPRFHLLVNVCLCI